MKKLAKGVENIGTSAVAHLPGQGLAHKGEGAFVHLVVEQMTGSLLTGKPAGDDMEVYIALYRGDESAMMARSSSFKAAKIMEVRQAGKKLKLPATASGTAGTGSPSRWLPVPLAVPLACSASPAGSLSAAQCSTDGVNTTESLRRPGIIELHTSRSTSAQSYPDTTASGWHRIHNLN